MREEEKIFAGKLFDATTTELKEIKHRTHELCRKYNSLDENNSERIEIIRKILWKVGEKFRFQGPIQFNYGCHTSIGENFAANFNLTVMDDGKITIGNNVMIGPNVSLLATSHPLIAKERLEMHYPDGHISVSEYAEEIVIEDNVWIASNVVICGGVRIGKGAVIGAGSVVVKDIPSNTIAYGNPCKARREITENDSKLHLL
jgi:maltose O-acetyltransferase